MAVASSTALDGSNAGCKSFRAIIPKDTASYFTTDGAYNLATGIGGTVSAPGAEKENVTKSCFASSVGILSPRLGGGNTRVSGPRMGGPHRLPGAASRGHAVSGTHACGLPAGRPGAPGPGISRPEGDAGGRQAGLR